MKCSECKNYNVYKEARSIKVYFYRITSCHTCKNYRGVKDNFVPKEEVADEK